MQLHKADDMDEDSLFIGFVTMQARLLNERVIERNILWSKWRDEHLLPARGFKPFFATLVKRNKATQQNIRLYDLCIRV